MNKLFRLCVVLAAPASRVSAPFVVLAALASRASAASVGTLPIVGALNNLNGNIQAAAFVGCIIVATGTFLALLRHHENMGSIIGAAMGVLGVCALTMGMGPLMTLIPGVNALTI